MAKSVVKNNAVAKPNNRIFLRSLHRMNIWNFEFPDLLLTQREWFVRFEEHYLPKLFEEISVYRGYRIERLVLQISDLTNCQEIFLESVMKLLMQNLIEL